MRALTRYKLRQLVVGIVLLTLAMSALIWLTQSLRLIQLIISNGISIGLFLELTMLLLPNFLVIILPITTFAVVLFAYNRMAMDRELTVMRAAGLGPWRLGRPAILLALMLTAFGFVLTLQLVPQSVVKFREMQWSIRHDVSHLVLREGEFTEIANGLTVYVRAQGTNGGLLDIMVHDTRVPDKKVTLLAESGRLTYADGAPRVSMTNGSRQEYDRITHQFSALYFDSYTMDFGSIEAEGGNRFRDARERSMTELLETAPSAVLSEADVRRFRVEAHKRLAAPFLPFTFTLIALAGILTGDFSRRGQTGRILVSVGAMAAVQTAFLGVENLASHDLGFVPLLYGVALGPAAVAAAILTRASTFGGRRPMAASAASS